jgi:radical SAM superfamily enzyme YgiQ (UPF0313 family)
MRVLLIQPPQSDPAQPYSSLAVLLAAWRSSGLSVDVLDLNLEFFDYLVRPDVVTRAVNEAERILSAAAYQDDDHLIELEQAVAVGQLAPSLTERAIGMLKNAQTFYEPDQYAWAIRMLRRTLGIHSASAMPGGVGLQTFRAGASYLSSYGIMAMTEDRRTNLFLRHAEAFAKDLIVTRRPDVVALSVTFQTQLIPAFTLARCIREWLPNTRVVLGGATITRIREKITAATHLFRDVDAFLLFEGETAFPLLLQEWEQGRDGLAAPNTVILDRGQVKTSTRIHTEDLNALPTADHAGLPLDRYWAPEPALLLNSSRGCYYGRCEFCMISPATWGPARMGKSYRLRSTDRVVDDIHKVHKLTGATAFNLANDILPPKPLAELGEALAGCSLPITWDSEIRLERGLNRGVLEKMHAGGCRHLRFGFESASTRVGTLMNKGTDLDVTERILKDCRDVGITVCLLTQVAFPGETEGEARETVDFLKRHADKVSFLSLTQFVLEEGSGVYQKPERFGLSILPNDDREDLSWMHAYRFDDGSGSPDAGRRYRDMETLLDQDYPDRDLFFKGGLGHAHTTLYTRRFAPQDFLNWNRGRFRPRPLTPGGSAIRLKTAEDISIWRYPDDGQSWSHLLASAATVPETYVRMGGAMLPILVAAMDGCDRNALIRVIRDLYDHDMPDDEADSIIGVFVESGMLHPIAPRTP